MPDHLASMRATHFAGFKPKPLTDQEPVFVHVPGSTSDLYHFCAKHKVDRGWGSDRLFILGACVGTPTDGVTAICGVIEVGRPTRRDIGDQYVAQIWTIAHDIVPGIRRFLVVRAVHAARALGFHRLLAGGKGQEGLLLECGFREQGKLWAADLDGQVSLPAHEGQERIALPGKPPLDTIEIP